MAPPPRTHTLGHSIHTQPPHTTITPSHPSRDRSRARPRPRTRRRAIFTRHVRVLDASSRDDESVRLRVRVVERSSERRDRVAESGDGDADDDASKGGGASQESSFG